MLMTHEDILPSKAEGVAMALVASCHFHVTFSDLVEERTWGYFFPGRASYKLVHMRLKFRFYFRVNIYLSL